MQEDLYIAFENYLNEEMPLEDKNAFEGQLQNDTVFKEKFELYKETTQFLELKFAPQTLDFKANLKTISDQHFDELKLPFAKKKSKVINLQFKWFSVAAVFVIGLGLWFISQGGNPSYNDFSQHQTANFIERSEGNVYLKEAQDFFNANQYKKAAASFAKINEANNPEIQLYYAISSIEIDEYPKAKKLLENISNGTSVYKEDAIWYLALSNLKQNKIEPCKSYLKQIPEDSERFAEAQKLLNDLN